MITVISIINKKIIGLIGYSGSGKDTIADFLVKNNGYTKIKFGDIVKQVLNDYFIDLTYEDLISRDIKIKKEDVNFFVENDRILKIVN